MSARKHCFAVVLISAWFSTPANAVDYNDVTAWLEEH